MNSALHFCDHFTVKSEQNKQIKIRERERERERERNVGEKTVE